MNKKITSLLLSVLTLGALTASAQTPAAPAAQAAPATAAPAATPAPAEPTSRIKFYGHAEVSFTANTNSPSDGHNFGRLFDDHSNQPLLNQFVYTAEQTLDPAAKGFDWGFKLQGMFGSDARFIHSLGLLDRSSKDLFQPDIVEAYLNLHFAAASTAGGVDVKVGKFVTLEGEEVIDSTGNIFFSHSYIFNFGIPFNHTGVLATIHATKDIDVMLGITRGVNTSLKDNNGAASFHGGLNLNNLAGGKLSFAISTHIGAETPFDNTHLRYLNDVVATYKVNDSLTAITDMNYAYDAGAKAKGYGVAQYFTYTITKTVTMNFRGEIWRDNNGFYVAQFGNNTDEMRFLRGDTFVPNSRTVGGGATTYGALTIGATLKPGPDWLVIRPELRYDKSLNDTTPFNDSIHKDMFTAAVDVTVSF